MVYLPNNYYFPKKCISNKFKIVNPIPEPLILIKGGKLRFMSYLPGANSITVGIGGDLF